jgi:8-oxo-dGTP diphosphatase
MMEIGESPYACACREAEEEIGVKIEPHDLHLFGVVSEHGYQGQAHWLIFLFEIKTLLKKLPPVHREGKFGFFRADQLASLKMPQSDLEQIWPLFWKYRHGFFAAHCHCNPAEPNRWIIEESLSAISLGAQSSTSKSHHA